MNSEIKQNNVKFTFRSFYTWEGRVDCEYLVKNCDISGGLGRSGSHQRCLVRNGLSMTLSILAAALCCHRRQHHRHNLQVVLLWVFHLYIGIIGIKNPTNINMIINIIRVRIPEWIPHHTTPHDQLEARCGEISRFLFLHHHLL